MKSHSQNETSSEDVPVYTGGLISESDSDGTDDESCLENDQDTSNNTNDDAHSDTNNDSNNTYTHSGFGIPHNNGTNSDSESESKSESEIESGTLQITMKSGSASTELYSDVEISGDAHTECSGVTGMSGISGLEVEIEDPIMKQLMIMNQNFLMMKSTVSHSLGKIQIEVQNLQDEISELRDQVGLALPKTKKSDKMVDIRKNEIEIKKEIMMKYLNYAHLMADKQLFKYYYLNNKKCPIRKISSSIYEYWQDGNWHVDKHGEYITMAVGYNLRKCWLRLKPLEQNNDMEKELFLNIQSHIEKLSKDDYKKMLFKNIVEDLPADE